MVTDLVARLGSRALVPAEVQTGWDLSDYVGLLYRDGVGAEVESIVRRARELRRLDPARLRAVLTALADPPGAELNKARIAAASGVPVTTLAPYVDALVELGVVVLLPGCRAAVAKRAIRRPRALVADAALGRHLGARRFASRSDLGARRWLAPHLRSLVATELVRQQATSVVGHRVGYLRERNGLAVDLVVELPDERVFSIEVRTAAALRPHQFDALHALSRRAGSRMIGGVVLNTASRGHRYGPQMWSLPISAVWE
ncbi:DUF4143 domain-containing protein [Nocardioides sp. R-C-SC26]|uniref:DUF4143 domain-containing protein n=1 Tax=Nocardioides sp. R-C-SC26 TaxID=2870414 RepID=UPI001E40C0DA|nr:DUF4143 domain-containing protein [Nocardioides sp. R-C-SC26]